MVIDEASAIQWLKQQLFRKPQTFQELHPQFMKEIGGWVLFRGYFVNEKRLFARESRE